MLYLAELDVLLTQPMDKYFAPAFGSDPVKRVRSGVDRSRELYFASYQAMSGPGDEDLLFQDYPSDFFDLVIVDECHRGSASQNSTWRRILEHFAPAVHLGLTATPKHDASVDTYSYFGEPVFTYSLRRGIEDGYLAPYRIRRVVLSPDAEGWEPEPGQLDRFGREIPEGVYSTRDFERLVSLLTRTELAAKHLSGILRQDPTARTMVFCVDQQHAEDMRWALVAANPDLVALDPEWVVRIVGSEPERVRLLEAFTDTETDSPVVATTSRLLSTGVDVEELKYVVLFRPIGSKVEFKQIIGRGTRLFPDKGKTSFEIIDYVGATAHFADPDFDGYPTVTTTYELDAHGDVVAVDGKPLVADPMAPADPTVSEPVPRFDPLGGPTYPLDPHVPEPPLSRKLFVDVGDFTVVAEGVLVPDTSTGRLTLTEYGEFVAARIRALASTPNELALRWSRAPARADVRELLAAEGIDVKTLPVASAADVDPMDLLIQVAWNIQPPTRRERARRVKEQHHAEMATLRRERPRRLVRAAGSVCRARGRRHDLHRGAERRAAPGPGLTARDRQGVRRCRGIPPPP